MFGGFPWGTTFPIMHCILAREVDGGSSSSMRLNFLLKLSTVRFYRLSYSPVMHVRIVSILISISVRVTQSVVYAVELCVCVLA